MFDLLYLRRINNKYEMILFYNLLPLLPPAFLVESVGIGVTSSILPILSPKRAKALMAV